MQSILGGCVHSEDAAAWHLLIDRWVDLMMGFRGTNADVLESAATKTNLRIMVWLGNTRDREEE
jgi:hypothetical protein